MTARKQEQEMADVLDRLWAAAQFVEDYVSEVIIEGVGVGYELHLDTETTRQLWNILRPTSTKEKP